MDSLNKLKLDIYESSLDNENKYELIDIINMYRNKINKNDIFTEKKTREEYRVERFKKKYNFKPDKPGSKTGTITINGKTHRVDMDIKNKYMDTPIGKFYRAVSTDNLSKDGKITIDKSFFDLKNDRRRDSILQHEVGHTKMHTINIDSNHCDKRFIDAKRIGDARKEIFDDVSDEYKHLSRRLKNTIVDNVLKHNSVDEKKYLSTVEKLKNNKENQQVKELRKELTKKYADKNIEHSNASEFEADRYAANKINEKDLKRGLREYNKRYLSDENLSKIYSMSKKDVKEKNIGKLNKIINKRDYESRVKALKDKEMKVSKLFK